MTGKSIIIIIIIIIIICTLDIALKSYKQYTILKRGTVKHVKRRGA